MTISPLRALYADACKSKRIAPNEPEWKEWKAAFGEFDLRDVQSALSAHWQDTREDEHGRKKGSFFPSVADLKPLVFRARARREREMATPQEFVAFRCGKCGAGLSCFIAQGTHRDPPQCRKCNLPMAQAHRSEPGLEQRAPLETGQRQTEKDRQLLQALRRESAA